ncbi:hypothetical protein RUND412_003728 [Rhizina undulata]
MSLQIYTSRSVSREARLKTPPPFLEEHLRCSICYDTFLHPIALPCAHTFCRHCIIRTFLAVDSVERCVCPLCRQPTLFATRNVKMAGLVAKFRKCYNIAIPNYRVQETKDDDLNVPDLFRLPPQQMLVDQLSIFAEQIEAGVLSVGEAVIAQGQVNRILMDGAETVNVINLEFVEWIRLVQQRRRREVNY